MSIVSSTFTTGAPQADGRTYVIEVHTDNVGLQYVVQYLAAVGADYTAVMTARAAQLSTQIADIEASNAIDTVGLTLNYQTKAEFAARFWKLVDQSLQNSNRILFEKLMYWLIERIGDGTITDAQALSTFNTYFGRALTGAQWTTLKTNRIQPAHDRWAALIAEAAL